jgi:hypothetical protein
MPTGAPFELTISPNGRYIDLTSWWAQGETRTVIVHPAFWTAAMEEIASLLQGKSTLLTRQGTKIDNLFPVTWA